jgi:hypothetical protein
MLLQFFEWTNNLAFSVAYRESLWYFPVTQAFHLVALAFFAGAILVVDARLLGAGLNKYPVATVARDAQPWFVGSFIVMTITGIPQFMSNAMRYYDNPVFYFKMGMLAVAFIYTVTIRRSVTRRDEARLGRVWPKIVALGSLVLWFIVTVGGRAIGFY